MKVSRILAIAALALCGQPASAMIKPPENDLSVATPPAKYLQNILHNNNVIGSAMYKDDDRGGRQILVSLNKAYENKKIEDYIEELLQPKVNAAKIEQSKKAIQEIDPKQLSLGKRLISSGSLQLLKNGSSIMTITYSDKQATENAPITRKLGVVNTNEDQRNKGYGSYLMESLIAKSRKENVSTIEIVSTADAIKFYERLGFVRQDQNAEPKMILKLK